MRNVLLIIGVLALLTGCNKNKGEIILKIDDGTGEPVKVLLNNDSENQVVVNIYCKDKEKPDSAPNQQNLENDSIDVSNIQYPSYDDLLKAAEGGN